MYSSSEDIKGNDATYNDSTILRDMEEMKVSPNVVTYTVLIDGHIKMKRQLDSVMKLLTKD